MKSLFTAFSVKAGVKILLINTNAPKIVQRFNMLCHYVANKENKFPEGEGVSRFRIYLEKYQKISLVFLKLGGYSGGLVFSKLFRLDRTNPLSFGPKFPEILVEWVAPSVLSPLEMLLRKQGRPLD